MESSAGASDLELILSAGSVSQIGRLGNSSSFTSSSRIGSTTTGDFLDISRPNAWLGLFIDLQIARADLPMVSTTGAGSQIVLDIIKQILLLLQVLLQFLCKLQKTGHFQKALQRGDLVARLLLGWR